MEMRKICKHVTAREAEHARDIDDYEQRRVTCSKHMSSTRTLATGPIIRAGIIITTGITTIEGSMERGQLENRSLRSGN